MAGSELIIFPKELSTLFEKMETELSTLNEKLTEIEKKLDVLDLNVDTVNCISDYTLTLLKVIRKLENKPDFSKADFISWLLKETDINKLKEIILKVLKTNKKE